MKKFSLLLMALLGCASVYAQSDSLQIEDLKFRLKKIEEFRLIDDKKFDNKAKELDLRIEEYRQQKSLLDWIAIALGPITLLSLWALWLKARTMADKKIEEKLENILNDKKQQFINIIDSHDKESKLKKSNKILILAAEDSNTDFLMDFFRKLEFPKPDLKKIAAYEALEEHLKYDILFLFRDIDNHPLDDEVAHQYIVNSRKDSIVFIFGKHINDASLSKSRTTSATFWRQLYGNLISALKYQDIID